MKNLTNTVISLIFGIVTPCIANEEGDPVFKSIGDALEEVVASVVESTIADEDPASFSVGVEDPGAFPGEEDLSSLPADIRARLSKRLPKIWANHVELDQVKFMTWGEPKKDRPNLILPKVPHDSKGRPIQFLRITGLRYVDDHTIQVTWKSTSGSPSGVAGTEVVKKFGNDWKILSSRVYRFD